MIKLNNKNITYVALADSNNSLKAPKEIWYADSNNSVKLVYRRKDALIEGVDYERYHWLVSNSEDSKTPYIDTLIPPNLNQNIISSFKVINSANNGGEPGIWGAILITSWSNCVIRCFKPKSYGYTILEFNNNNVDFPSKENMIIKTEFSEGKEYDSSLSINSSTTALGVINGESKELVANSNVNFVLNPQPTYKLFVELNTPTWSFNSVGFKKFSITNLISLVPCKLLKPVPKWLDANGIRRQVGECGMIDLVSGKFYGNVNSVGTFTVENYYERKEWLIADIPEYARCIDLPINSNEMSYSMSIQKVGNNTFFETIGNYRYYTTIGTLPSIRAWNISTSSDVSTFNVGLQENKLFNITSNESSLTINGIEIQKFGFPISAIVFRSGGTLGNAITETSPIFVNGVERYIPCTLTMDLPASMDANNIARTKGTSGMWDLVSDRFYGNVANSGTFKAVNLAEGVDYEVHQWLKVSVSTMVDMAALPVDSTNLYFKHKHISGVNYHYFRTTGEGVDYDYYYELDTHRCSIWNLSNKTAVYRTSDITEDEIVINCNSSNRYVNGYDIPIYGSTIKQVSIISKNQNGFEGLISSITVDDVERYIPVKLLKSIPSKYDANGIARQAGECGMYDTVNDIFYGNVASSGTFSVSDDS